ncbi:MAG: hypothetical protein ACRELG_21530, partial [Gemmataceae bacterium]
VELNFPCSLFPGDGGRSMQFMVTIGQRWRVCSWCAMGKVLAIGILLAVPSLGLARLSADFFASWQGRSAEEAVLANSPADGLLAFDAPASTLRQYQLRVKDSVSTTGSADGATQPSLLADDWRNTAQPTSSASTINGLMATLVRDQVISDALLLNEGASPDIVNLYMLEQSALNQTVTQNLMAISQTTSLNVPMINGFIGSLVVKELLIDAWLTANGASTSTLSSILGNEIGFNEVVTQYFLSVSPTPLTPATPTS